MRSTIRICSVVLAVILAASIIVGCSGSGKQTSNSTSPVPKDPGPITVVAGQATTLDLGDGQI